MAAPTNAVTTEQVATGLDIEFNQSFTGEYDRLAELLGLFEVDVMGAGQALYQYKVSGALAETVPGEGEAAPLSQYKVDKVPIGDLTPERFQKLTTAEAILKSGFDNAVLKTDKKMLAQLRKRVLGRFFDLLGNGTGAATGAGLQGALAKADAALGDALEDNDDEETGYLHFVNRQDIAAYLADAEVTTQTAFGMTFLQSFLGVENIFVTNRVPSGTLYVTPVGNLHVYGVDFSSLGEAGLAYEQSDSGLVGVHHAPDYDLGSANTYALLGMALVPETLDYIVKGTVAAAPSGGGSGSGTVAAEALDDQVDGPSAGDEPDAEPAAEEPSSEPAAAPADPVPTEANTVAEIAEYASAHGISLAGAKTKADQLAAIEAALKG